MPLCGRRYKAYGTGRPVDEIQRLERRKREFYRDEYNRVLKEEFKGAELEKFFNYLDKQHVSLSLYRDYFTACRYIGLDMNSERNRYPHDFFRWHDVRIEEYRTMRFADEKRERAERDARLKKELAERFEKFGEIARKYLNLNKNGHLYSVAIAMSPAELVREGKVLHHCVGQMGYDRKFAEERSLIFFVRRSAAPETPFVTMEYSPESGRILQCYADRNTMPDEDVLKFINKTWLPYANRKLKQMRAA